MANTYLTRTTNTSGASRTTWTWSGWIKRGTISDGSQVLVSAYGDSNNYMEARISSPDNLQFRALVGGNWVGRKYSNRKFRDNSGWYNLVLVWDTTNSTASERMRIYVNGVQETSFATSENPGSGQVGEINASGTMQIGAKNGADFFNGSMSYVAFVDGTAELPTIFGETDSVTGQWKIKTDITPSVAWGTNGFLILKNGNSLTDESTNTNNFTLGAGTLTNTLDCPSNVFATMNPLDNAYASSTFSNGNNTIVTNSGNYTYNSSTLAFSSGKYYCEAKLVSASAEDIIGISSKLATSSTVIMGSNVYSQGYRSGGNSYTNNVQSSYGSSYTTGDIIGLAIDADNQKLYFSKNGTFQNSGDPESGATGTGALSFPTDNDGVYYITMYDIDGSGSCTWSTNFGNGYFGTTAVSSAGTPGSTPGTFEYDVPSGYQPLSTKGLNA